MAVELSLRVPRQPSLHCPRFRWEDALTCDASSWGFRRNADYSAYLPVSFFIAQLVEVSEVTRRVAMCPALGQVGDAPSVWQTTPPSFFFHLCRPLRLAAISY